LITAHIDVIQCTKQHSFSAISSPPTKSSVDSTRRPRNSVNCDERGIEAQKWAEPSILLTFMAHIPYKLNTPALRHYCNVVILRTSNWH